MTQELIVYAILLVSASAAVYKVVRSLKPAKSKSSASSACGGCSGCSVVAACSKPEELMKTKHV